MRLYYWDSTSGTDKTKVHFHPKQRQALALLGQSEAKMTLLLVNDKIHAQICKFGPNIPFYQCKYI